MGEETIDLEIDLSARPATAVQVDPTPDPEPMAWLRRYAEGHRREVIPGWWVDRFQRGRVLDHLRVYAWHRIRYHGVRAPWYAVLLTGYATRGAWRLTARTCSWVTLGESMPLRRTAIASGDHDEWIKEYDRSVRAAKPRLIVAAAVTAIVCMALGMLYLSLPGAARFPALIVAALTTFYGLVRAGAPAGGPIIGRAVIRTEAPRITSELIIRALESLGVAGIKEALAKDPNAIRFPAPIQRDGPGWRAEVELPLGITATAVADRRERLAAALARPLGCVWPETHTEVHPGRLILWVGDQDMAVARQPAWPLLKAGTTDLFEPLPFGTDQRGKNVPITLMFASMVCGAIPRMGKALDVTTQVPTPTGWTTMGDLNDGDIVFDERGRPCMVTTAWPVMHDRPCYEVEFSDGTTVVADADHLWSVQSRRSRMSAQRRAMLQRKAAALGRASFARDQSDRWISHPPPTRTEDLIPDLYIKEGDRERANYSIPLAAPLDLPTADLPISPYTLGAWLGDGTSLSGQITTVDAEILRRIEQDGYETHFVPSSTSGGRCPSYNIVGLYRQLRLAGLRGNKHIPVEYLRASERQRRELLSGLLDTDGWCEKSGVVQYCGINERLVRGVHHLAATLGYRPTLTTKTARIDGRDCGTAWFVTFTPSDPVFVLPRKNARRPERKVRRNDQRYIVAIRAVESRPVRCITVDSPSHLYLVTEACVPTHNTVSIRLLATAAALDVRAELHLYDLKGTGDFSALEPVAHRYRAGDDIDDLDYLIADLRELRDEMKRRAKVIRGLPRDVCPDNKVTPALASQARLGLHPLLLLVDETQAVFGDGRVGKEAAAICEDLVRRGPALGIISIFATQRPDKESIPTGLSGNAIIRFCLRVMGQVENDMVLGTSAYKNGTRATLFTRRDRGIGYLSGEGDDPVIVRTYYLDAPATETVIARARANREAAGRITGHALGETVDTSERSVRDFLRDVLAVTGPTERRIWSSRLLAALAEWRAEIYEGWTPVQLAAAFEPHGVTSKPTHGTPDPGDTGSKTRQGYDLDTVREAHRRAAQ